MNTLYEWFLRPDSISNIATIENERDIESNIAQYTVEVSLEEPSAAGRGALSQIGPQSHDGMCTQWHIIISKH